MDDLVASTENALATGPFGSSIGSRFFLESGVPVIRGSNLTNDGHTFLIEDDFVFVSEEKAREFRWSTAHRGDLVFTCWGTIDQVGLIGSESSHDEYVVSNKQMKLTADPKKANSIFLFYLFSGSHLQCQIRINSIGSSVPGFNLGRLRALRFHLPPLHEQEGIADALSDADFLIESLGQLIDKKRQVKQGAMQELLTGRRRLVGFSGEWEVKRFGDIAQPRKERVDPGRTDCGGFCVELEHVGQGTGTLSGHTSTSEESSQKAVFRKNDVLFGRLRAYLRKFWLADCDGVCSTEIWPLVAKPACVVPAFLFQLVRTDRFIEAASTAYGTHMPRSDWSVVRALEVLSPSLPEQTAIAAVLSDMDAEIAVLEAKLAKARLVKQGMMQELLTGRIRLV